MTQTFKPMKELPADWRTMRATDPRWAEWAEDGSRKSDAWTRTLRQGQIVHYHHGFGAWVRCEVVDHPLRVPESVGRDPSVPSLVPLHMVGPQWPRDWPVTRERWTERIRTGESFQPNAENVYESPYWTDGGPDPATMEVFQP